MVRIELLPVGESIIPGPELFWMSRFGEWLPLLFQAVLVRTGDRIVLINTGPAEDLGPMNAQWAGFLGEKAAMRRREGWFIVDHLRARGIALEDVTDVVLTPLQLYTTSNVPLFPNATFHISKRGWVHYHTTHEHPHDDRWSSLPKEVLSYLVIDAWDRVHLLEDEAQIAPSVRSWWAGTHHRASMVVEVNEGERVIAISDAFFWLENVEEDHPIGINESIAEALETYQRVRETADVVIPLYDPKNLERFPDGLVIGRGGS